MNEEARKELGKDEKEKGSEGLRFEREKGMI